MYIQQPKGLPSACWGGLMSTRAQKLGSLGTIIDGRMRDMQEHIDMKYPVRLRIIADLRPGANRDDRSSQEALPSSDRTRSLVPQRSMYLCSSRAISGCIRTTSWSAMRMVWSLYRRLSWIRSSNYVRSASRLMRRLWRHFELESQWARQFSACASSANIIPERTLQHLYHGIATKEGNGADVAAQLGCAS